MSATGHEELLREKTAAGPAPTGTQAPHHRRTQLPPLLVAVTCQATTDIEVHLPILPFPYTPILQYSGVSGRKNNNTKEGVGQTVGSGGKGDVRRNCVCYDTSRAASLAGRCLCYFHFPISSEQPDGRPAPPPNPELANKMGNAYHSGHVEARFRVEIVPD